MKTNYDCRQSCDVSSDAHRHMCSLIARKYKDVNIGVDPLPSSQINIVTLVVTFLEQPVFYVCYYLYKF
jgi:hypothetical protein